MRYYIFAFIVIYELIFGVYFYSLYIKNIEEYSKQTIELVNNSFKSVVNGYEMISDDFYSNESDVLSRSVHLSNNASLEKRDEIRKELLNEFMDYFDSKKLNSLNAFEIFDSKGKAILRFDQPYKYDDDVAKKRESLKRLGENFSFQKGFEFNGYQEAYCFEYPLFYNGKFAGSYMYGVDSEALMSEMSKIYGEHYQLLFKSQPIHDKVLSGNLQKYYKRLDVDSRIFYLKKHSYKKEFDRKRFEYISKLQSVKDALKLSSISVINYRYKDRYCAVVIVPIYDINKKDIGYLLVHIRTLQPHQYKNILYLELFFVTLFGFMLYLYISKEIKNRQYTRKLINLQRDLIVVSDGENIQDTNDAFLEFFNYKSMDDFKREHQCICDFFVKAEGYIQEKIYDTNWIKYVYEHPKKEHKVKFLNTKNEERIFILEVEKIEGSRKFFLLFRDITDDLKIKAELEARANFDSLTGIFNRSRFEFFLQKEIEKSNRYGNIFSLIMFDIDHFKDINDTYGHSVGDIILKELTALIAMHVRDVDIFARWGGEEFMIISQTNLYQTKMFSEKLRTVIENNTFNSVDVLTCSFGVTQCRDKDTIESIVKRCDTMLYEAKESGRNRIVASD